MPFSCRNRFSPPAILDICRRQTLIFDAAGFIILIMGSGIEITIPDYVAEALDALGSGGFEAYVVGGCVRDSLLGLAPEDWDIATDATPDEVSALFVRNKTLAYGQRYGTIAVIFGDRVVEITTYRRDGVYTDCRRPDGVEFTRNVRDDMSRRDFTINSIAYNRENGLVDYFDGCGDIRRGVVRCVGNARERFGEDSLRILRALRFASRLSFTIERSTADAIRALSKSLGNVARERVCAELSGILCGTAEGLRAVLTDFFDVFTVLIPDLLDLDDAAKNKTIEAILHLRKEDALIGAGKGAYKKESHKPDNMQAHLTQRMAILLHRIGRAPDDNASIILRGLRFDNKFVDDVCLLIKHVKMTDSIGKLDKIALKKLMSAIGADLTRQYLNIRRALAAADATAAPAAADATAAPAATSAVTAVPATAAPAAAAATESKNNARLISEIDNAGLYMEEIIEKGECYSLKDLRIDGNDLIKLGFRQGRELGGALAILLDSVINGDCANTRADLLNRARTLLNA